MAEVKLSAQEREEFGKGAARRIRRADMIPAVIYGPGQEPVHITLPSHETTLALREPNVLLELAVGDAKHLVIPKQIQRDPIRRSVEHIDLLVVKRGQKVQVDVPVHVEGTVKGGLVTTDVTTLALQAIPSKIPSQVVIDVSELEVGDRILAGDVKLPEGSTLDADPEMLIVNISAQMSEAALEASLAADDGEAGEVGVVGEESDDSSSE